MNYRVGDKVSICRYNNYSSTLASRLEKLKYVTVIREVCSNYYFMYDLLGYRFFDHDIRGLIEEVDLKQYEPIYSRFEILDFRK